MTSANLNISVIEKRMLSQTEAAAYTGLPLKHFKASCPVQPCELHPGRKAWDKRELDRWIDAMKEGADISALDAILDKLS